MLAQFMVTCKKKCQRTLLNKQITTAFGPLAYKIKKIFYAWYIKYHHEKHFTLFVTYIELCFYIKSLQAQYLFLAASLRGNPIKIP